MNLSHLRTQVGLISIFLHNILYNIIPFFFLKNIYLRLTGIEIGNNSYIHTLVRFTFFGRLVIGNNCTVNFDCFLDNRGKLTVGNNVMIGHKCKIYTAGHDIHDDDFKGFYKPVDIEDNVILFPNVIVMPGIRIGENSIVLNGSVVTKNIGANEVVGGNPAKLIKMRTSTAKYNLDYGFWFINS
jgi:acetyltransferase-like isoleucine patch superfamily enzyme